MYMECTSLTVYSLTLTDKHKAHHLRDEQLIRDGFKKFMKNESCAYPACAFARVVNHIHCIRPGMYSMSILLHTVYSIDVMPCLPVIVFCCMFCSFSYV